jgi:glycosyltransferase involved in cell wall biosynthesis
MIISVIMPVYNAEKFVREAVASIVEQEHVGEVILVEDGSRDDSFSICRELAAAYPKVALFRHSNGENRGAGASRNLGVLKAQCDLIAFLDADDVALPNRFKLPLEILAGDPSVDGVYEAIGVMFEDDGAKELWDAFRGKDLTTLWRFVPPNELFYSLVMYDAGHFHLDGFVIKKSLFHKAGGFNESLRLHQDTDFCIKTAAFGILLPGRLRESVALRRVHGGNRFVKLKPRKEVLQSRILQWQALYQWARETNQRRWRRLIVQYQLFNCLKASYRAKENYPVAVFYFGLSRLMRFVIWMRRRILGAASF